MAHSPTRRMSRTSRRVKSHNNNMYMMVGIIAIASLAMLGLILWNQSNLNKISTLDDPRFAVYAGIPLDDSITNASRDIQTADDLADGVVQGITEDGIPFIGSPDAPVVFAEFSDFSCPHCREYESIVEPLVRDYVRAGKLRLEFYPLTFVGDNYSVTATLGAICAAEQGTFWEFQKEIFHHQFTQGAKSFTQNNVVQWGEDLGLNADDLRKCMNSSRPDRAMNIASALQNSNGITGTPSLLYRDVNSAVWTKFPDPTYYDALVEVINRFNTDSTMVE